MCVTVAYNLSLHDLAEFLVQASTKIWVKWTFEGITNSRRAVQPAFR